MLNWPPLLSVSIPKLEPPPLIKRFDFELLEDTSHDCCALNPSFVLVYIKVIPNSAVIDNFASIKYSFNLIFYKI